MRASSPMGDYPPPRGPCPWHCSFSASPAATAAFFIFFISALAEGNRTPFDLPEAESELVAGYLTEYSGMRWGTLLALSEYGNVTVVCSIMATLWFGGWQGPGVDAFPLIGVVWFTLKVYGFILIMMWI